MLRVPVYGSRSLGAKKSDIERQTSCVVHLDTVTECEAAHRMKKRARKATMWIRASRLLLYAQLILILLLAGDLGAAPRADLWPRWQQHDPTSTTSIDHTKWDSFLDSYVVGDHPSGINRVRYGDVTGTDRRTLKQYIEQMEAIPISQLDRREQLAYWINLYNAATVDLVLDHYPVDSIRDINPSSGFLTSLFGGGPWQEELLSVEGEDISLDDIEHRILRPIWRDSRIHYAVNCASLGCPDLQPKAFTAANTEDLLNQGARAYINHPRGVSFRDGELRLSKIYDWFEEDFDSSTEGVMTHLMRYADPALREQLRHYEGPISYAYDWSLNDTSQR